ncbi:hypothetical protein Barb7_00998 [Bacteroidales bacterium Barb7]|nr:hypothetical protein Barb7_00998 [Bacteroidales bacterium Barb7]
MRQATIYLQGGQPGYDILTLDDFNARLTFLFSGFYFLNKNKMKKDLPKTNYKLPDAVKSAGEKIG